MRIAHNAVEIYGSHPARYSQTDLYKLWFLPSARRLILVNICMKFHEDTLSGFQVTERTRFCDGQTDGWSDRQTTQAKTICLQTLTGGDITNDQLNP